ncbi:MULTISPECIES: 5'-3' exonuclease [Pseudonocardia]|uniref:5'-3' exonuclease n=2 Tax=Pseudonocardia TaxID=1847 RepID=A0A1Y2N312_PSEAH|nr:MULTISPECIES: 5'-3' exonuclease [Pseudonocardia]OSY41549.1 DNA polymerase I [Pseudonocardia autotrophica]TDN71504.1 5'-3' exonuclease [Pseudonocardia autotrophica]BBG02183.1 5'-3' exonuclease [Pseudonocardia autotrophica]
MSDRPLMLLDSASMYFRAYFGVPESITAPDGTPVNAVRGFTDMISRLVTEHRPRELVACLDLDWRPAFRVAALPSYKAHRVVGGDPADGGTGTAEAGVPEEVPDTLAPQVPVIMEVLAAAGICTGGAEGHEADDVIGTLAHRAETGPVLAVSGDRDLIQIVRDEPQVRLLYIGRGLNRAELMGPAEVAAKFGLPTERAGAAYAEMAMLRGDPSDGLPGVPGVGAKTAATLVGRFDSWGELLAAVTRPDDTRMASGVRAKLMAASDYLGVVEPVVRVVTDAQVDLDRDTVLPRTPADPDRLDELAARWGLESSVRRLRTALDAAAS